MYKFTLFAIAVIAAVSAAPQHLEEAAAYEQHGHEQHPVYIVKHDANVHPEGYNFDFETSDGTQRQEEGTLKQITEDHKAIEVTGSYRYVAPDGVTYTVTYVANEHGFQPQEHVEHS